MKPCPNPECNCIHIYCNDDDDRDFYAVECYECALLGPSCENYDKAVRLWNLLPRIEPKPKKIDVDPLKFRGSNYYEAAIGGDYGMENAILTKIKGEDIDVWKSGKWMYKWDTKKWVKKIETIKAQMDVGNILDNWHVYVQAKNVKINGQPVGAQVDVDSDKWDGDMETNKEDSIYVNVWKSENWIGAENIEERYAHWIKAIETIKLKINGYSQNTPYIKTCGDKACGDCKLGDDCKPTEYNGKKIDREKWPHTCDCGAPAYLAGPGYSECSNPDCKELS